MSRHFNHTVRIEHLQSGVNIPGSRGPGNLGQGLRPGLIIKSRTGTGTQIQYLRDWGPGLKSENPGSVTGTGPRNNNIRDTGLGAGLRFVGRGIPGLNYSGLSRGQRT